MMNKITMMQQIYNLLIVFTMILNPAICLIINTSGDIFVTCSINEDDPNNRLDVHKEHDTKLTLLCMWPNGERVCSSDYNNITLLTLTSTRVNISVPLSGFINNDTFINNMLTNLPCNLFYPDETSNHTSEIPNSKGHTTKPIYIIFIVFVILVIFYLPNQCSHN